MVMMTPFLSLPEGLFGRIGRAHGRGVSRGGGQGAPHYPITPKRPHFLGKNIGILWENYLCHWHISRGHLGTKGPNCPHFLSLATPHEKSWIRPCTECGLWFSLVHWCNLSAKYSRLLQLALISARWQVRKRPPEIDKASLYNFRVKKNWVTTLI